MATLEEIEVAKEAARKALEAYQADPNNETSAKAQEALDRFNSLLGQPWETWRAIQEVMG